MKNTTKPDRFVVFPARQFSPTTHAFVLAAIADGCEYGCAGVWPSVVGRTCMAKFCPNYAVAGPMCPAVSGSRFCMSMDEGQAKDTEQRELVGVQHS